MTAQCMIIGFEMNHLIANAFCSYQGQHNSETNSYFTLD